MPANDRLRSALNAAGLTPEDLAGRLDVDPKTVARWISQGRTPYAKHRAEAAAILREDESYLWPDSVGDAHRTRAAESEVVRVYPHRALIPPDFWGRLMGSATEAVDILVYAALFLPEQQPRLLQVLDEKAASGIPVRILLGRPDSEAVAVRSEEEGIGRSTIGVKIRNALKFYEPYAGPGRLDVRLHDTTLYSSIYRADNEMLVNQHVYGRPAAHAPTLHLRRLPPGDLFDMFAETFDTIWARSVPAAFEDDGEEVA